MDKESIKKVAYGVLLIYSFVFLFSSFFLFIDGSYTVGYLLLLASFMFELIGIQIKHSYKKTNREKINEMSDKKFILFLEEIYSEGKRNYNFEYDLEWCKKREE